MSAFGSHSEVTPGQETLCAEDVRSAVGRIRKSSVMRGAEKLQQLLNFLAEATLEGRTADLKQTTVGAGAFGRAPDYDPKTDAIVRTQVWRLRRKLKKYYSSEGVSDPVLIEIPLGQYVPVFNPRPDQSFPELSAR